MKMIQGGVVTGDTENEIGSKDSDTAWPSVNRIHAAVDDSEVREFGVVWEN